MQRFVATKKTAGLARWTQTPYLDFTVADARFNPSSISRNCLKAIGRLSVTGLRYTKQKREHRTSAADFGPLWNHDRSVSARAAIGRGRDGRGLSRAAAPADPPRRGAESNQARHGQPAGDRAVRER